MDEGSHWVGLGDDMRWIVNNGFQGSVQWVVGMVFLRGRPNNIGPLEDTAAVYGSAAQDMPMTSGQTPTQNEKICFECRQNRVAMRQ